MFVGHLAVALSAKKLDGRLPLSAATAASFGIDLLWPLLVLAGIEVVKVDPGNTAFTGLSFESYPWSHSLLMTLVWSAIAGIVAFFLLKSKRRGLIVSALVVSHWVLDLITHRPDLPLWPGGEKVGLGLWNSIPGTMLLEGGMFVFAIVIYLRATESKDKIGTWALWGLILLTGGIWASQPWAAPPPGAMAVAVVGLAMWILPFWAGWIERHRTTS
jgi:membrane-bound metal-dependent hydrolase YbcI (DUF457 family)